jgi:dihydroorotase
MTVLIRGARVMDASSPFHDMVVDIFMDKGVIQAIDHKLELVAQTIVEHDGLHVSAGWTDIFADYSEPGYEHKETIHSGLASAAAGGFTDVMTVPNTSPVTASKSLVQYQLKQAEGHVVQLHPLGAISKDAEGKNLAEMLDMHAHGAIAFTDGWKPVQSANLMLKALEYAKAFDGTLIQIPCDTALAGGGLMHEGPESTQLGMAGIPALAETLQLYRDIELLRYTGSRLHITGVSAEASVELIRRAKSEGLDISCSVTPYHLVYNDTALRSYNSMYKVMPPLRSEQDRLALVAGLADGTIDCIASHHRPQEWDAKAKEFEYAAEGMNSQELAFAAVYNTLKGQVADSRIIDALSAKPAALFGLNKAGVQKGATADLTLFSFAAVTHKNNLHSRSANNPFSGRTLAGKVLGVIKNTKIVFNDNY